jgi:hypothetical protein
LFKQSEIKVTIKLILDYLEDKRKDMRNRLHSYLIPFMDLYKIIQEQDHQELLNSFESELSFLSNTLSDIICRCTMNVECGLNILKLREKTYQMIGFCFLDNKGNFGKYLI